MFDSLARKIILVSFFLCLGIIIVLQILIYSKEINSFFLKSALTSFIRDPKTIIVQSKLPGYELEIKDKNALEYELERIGFWKENGVANFFENNKRTTAKTLKITFTKEIPEAFSVILDENGNEMLKVGAKVEQDGTVLVDVYESPEIRLGAADQEYSMLDYGFWKAIYVVNKFQGKSTDKIDAGLADNFASLRSKITRFFEVKSK